MSRWDSSSARALSGSPSSFGLLRVVGHDDNVGPGIHKAKGANLRGQVRSVGARLRSLREGLGLSRRECAERFGLSEDTLVRWEKDQKKDIDRADMLLQLALEAECRRRTG